MAPLGGRSQLWWTARHTAIWPHGVAMQCGAPADGEFVLLDVGTTGCVLRHLQTEEVAPLLEGMSRLVVDTDGWAHLEGDLGDRRISVAGIFAQSCFAIGKQGSFTSMTGRRASAHCLRTCRETTR